MSREDLDREGCEACAIEARIGTEEVPHPVDRRLHDCVRRVAPRLVVRWFAEEMETALRANDHKGGWDDCTLGYLLKRLQEEVEELVEAAQHGHAEACAGEDGLRRGPWTEASARRVVAEAADVANFAMMVADACERRRSP